MEQRIRLRPGFGLTFGLLLLPRLPQPRELFSGQRSVEYEGGETEAVAVRVDGSPRTSMVHVEWGASSNSPNPASMLSHSVTFPSASTVKWRRRPSLCFTV